MEDGAETIWCGSLSKPQSSFSQNLDLAGSNLNCDSLGKWPRDGYHGISGGALPDVFFFKIYL